MESRGIGSILFAREGATVTDWYYNNKTGQVEEGKQSLASDLDGPFASREEAARAPEIIAERARKWAEDDAKER
nr:methionine aminopeptidase [Galbitalea soli]